MPAFTATERDTTLEQLATGTFDIVVVGGGITGCGVALDAAARGLRVALIDKGDVASGTSSKSSKLVHGGLRYLQSKDFALVYEGLAERQRLLRNAPHLVRELDFVIPVWGKKAYAKAANSALWWYDVTGGWRIGKLHKPIGPDVVSREWPGVRQDGLLGGFYYPDAQTDDARLTLALARTAAVRFGATVGTYLAAVGLDDGAGSRLGGVVVRDTLAPEAGATGGATGAPFTISAKVIVNAGGVWSADIAALGGRGPGELELRPARGAHLTVPRAAVGVDRAIVVPVPKDRRSIFIVPWGEVAWIGTTDTDHDGGLDDPQATPSDVAYLLRAANHWTTRPLTEADILTTWAGLRPLVADASDERTADLSRRHSVRVDRRGMVTVTGGKLTTYRKMAADAVDAAVDLATFDVGPSPTKRLIVDGGAGFNAGELTAALAAVGDPSDGPGGAARVRQRLVERHGTHARAVARLIADEPDLGRRLVPELPYVRAEVVRAVRAEGASSVADVLERRVRLALEHRGGGVDALDDVVALMGDELGWDSGRRSAEADAYRRRAAAGAPPAAASPLTP